MVDCKTIARIMLRAIFPGMLLQLMLCFALVLPYSVFAQTCERIEKTITLPAPTLAATCNPQLYLARDRILLTPGFTYQAQAGRRLHAKIDNTLLFPTDYNLPQFADVKTIDTDLPVGTTAGSAGVSPSGAATYKIPIHIPPGTAGMQPSLSIVYNSSAGNSQLGWGWNLLGLSSITRTGKSIYHEGEYSVVTITSEDRYMLDGNRLIPTDGTHGVTNEEYRTELETFNLVTSNGTIGDGPESFIVKTKGGLIMEYGTTSDARFITGLPGTPVLIWRISKIIDQHDNFIEFKYLNENHETRIDEISYTGNMTEGLTPYNKIKFYYSEREDNNEQWITNINTKLKTQYLLRLIRVFAEGKNVIEYELKHTLGHTNELYSMLTEIIETNAEGGAFNSTIFDYGDYPQSFIGGSDALLGQTGDIVVGDFNGDGRSDMIFANSFDHGNGIKSHFSHELYLSNIYGTFSDPPDVVAAFPLTDQAEIETPTGFFSSTTVSALNSLGLTASDYNGDGKDDFIVTDKHWDGTYHRLDKIRVLSLSGTSFTEQIHSVTSDNIIHPNFKYFYKGDFNGDGMMDFILFLSDGGHYTSYIYYPSLGISGTIVDFNIPGQPFGEAGPIVLSDKIFVIDFNGDGKSDLMVVDGSTTTIYSFTTDGSSVTVDELYSAGYPNSGKHIHPGDFNGDGKTDLLTASSLTQPVWEIAYSTGTAFFITDFNFNTFNTSPKLLKIGDYNGDGKTDVMQQFPLSFEVYYSSGSNFIHDEYVHNRIFTSSLTGDFNGDGSLDEMGRTLEGPLLSPTVGLGIFYFNQDSRYHKLNIVANGLNHQTKFQYGILSQAEISTLPLYIKGTGATFPIIDVQGPLYMVSSIITPNGIGGTSTTSYEYKRAKTHKHGKGFLGFEEIITKNATLDRKTTLTNNLDPTYLDMRAVANSITTLGGTAITSTTYVNDNIVYPNKRHFPFVDNSTTVNHLTNTEVGGTSDYNSDGNLISQITNYDSDGITIVINDYETFGSWWMPSKIKSTTTKKQIGSDPLYIRKTEYTYTSEGQIETMIVDPLTTNQLTTTYTYGNPFGNLSHTILEALPAEGLTPRFSNVEYDDKGRFVTKKTNALGHFITSQYEPAFGNILTRTAIDGQTLSFSYDAFGKSMQTISPEGNKINVTRSWSLGSPAFAVYSIETNAPGAPDSKTFNNILGNSVRNETSGFNDLIVVDKEYNSDGTVHRVSHPYYAGSGSPVWVTYGYDPDFKYVNSEQNPFLVDDTEYDILGKITTITDPVGRISTRTVDGFGNLISTSEPGSGTVTNVYHSSGQVKSITAAGTTTEMVHDEYGRQRQLIDPNAGTVLLDYNAYGELTEQIDANSKVYIMTYDIIGRLETKTGIDGPYTYNYVSSGNGLESISSETGPGGTSKSYEYDALGRQTSITENIQGDVLVYRFEYDNFGNVTTLTFPSDYSIFKNYDSNGYLRTVNGPQGNIYTANAMNALDQYTKYTLGNSITTENTYNDFGLISAIESGNLSTTIQDLVYEWNTNTGNLIERADLQKSRLEIFDHDNLNRLESAQVQTPTVDLQLLTTSYEANGNISSKSDIGSYTYVPSRPHAVDHVTNSEGVIASETQMIGYTSFNKVSSINEGDYELLFTYGTDNLRIKTELKHQTVTERVITYSGSYDKIVDAANTYEVHYINCGPGLNAINVIQNNNSPGDLYYIYTDHLGSISTITNSDASLIVYEQNFDPWGQKRNANSWEYPTIANPLSESPPWLIRGFTGHEHLEEFALINMNGRVYDPLLGRVLSADNFVQDNTSTQGLNRYSYTLNSPLRYTDPSGEFIWIPIAIGAAMGAYSGYQIGTAAGATGVDLVGYMAGGAIIGGAAAGIGAGAGGAIAGASFAGSNALGAAVGGAVSGSLSSGGFASVAGADVGDAIGRGAISGAAGGLVGGALPGPVGAFGGGAVGGAIGADMAGSDVGQGALSGGIAGLASYGVSSFTTYRAGFTSEFTYGAYLKVSSAYSFSQFWQGESSWWGMPNGKVSNVRYGLPFKGEQGHLKPGSGPVGALYYAHSHPKGSYQTFSAHDMYLARTAPYSSVPMRAYGHKNMYTLSRNKAAEIGMSLKQARFYDDNVNDAAYESLIIQNGLHVGTPHGLSHYNHNTYWFGF